MNEVTINIPIPAKELNPNSRVHWAVKARAVKKQRINVYWKLMGLATKNRILGYWNAATVQIEATYKDKRRRDKDNLLASLKSAFDGAEDAGLIKNDSGFTYLPIKINEPDKTNPHIKLTFTKES